MTINTDLLWQLMWLIRQGRFSIQLNRLTIKSMWVYYNLQQSMWVYYSNQCGFTKALKYRSTRFTKPVKVGLL